MFDKPRVRFIDFDGFGVRKPESLTRVRGLSLFLVAAFLLGGCSPQQKPGTVEDTVTSGRISIMSAPEAFDLITREQARFSTLYPQATIEVRAGSSRDAVAALFAARCDLAVITRDLEPVERRAAVQGRLELEGYRFARDALVMVVNPANPVENIALDDVRRIYRGELKRWTRLGGENRDIVPLVQQPGSDIGSFFVQEVMGGEPVTAPAAYAESDSLVVARVLRDPGAIGYVSLAWASRGARALRVASLTGLPYWKPDLEAVYHGDYPLTRYFNLYVRASGPKLANGFITFVTSFEGQDLVHQAGFVPSAVPVRFVRRSPMLSAHSEDQEP